MERLMQYIWQHRLWTPPHSATVGETDLYDVDTSDTSLFETEWVRDYDGPYVYFMNDLERVLTPTGNYLPYKGFQHFIKNHNGDIVDIVPNTDDTYWETYYPFGGMFYFGEANARYRFSGKEFDYMNGLNWYDFHARHYDPVTARFPTQDPLAEKYYSYSPYSFCAGNPINFIDPTGLAWRPISETDKNGNITYLGYEWIEPDKSYGSNGVLIDGLYEQAIFFTDNETFDSSSKYNMGSSTAIVYKSDGTTEEFDATTRPSDIDKFATIPAGIYHAKVGLHKGQYTALRMSDTDNSGRINLGMPNPSNPKINYAQGINIHKPGLNNLTGIDSKNRAISQGCLLIDRTKWSQFISIFNTPSQKINTISVIVQRK